MSGNGVELELEPYLQVMVEEIRSMNASFFELMKQSQGSFDTYGAFGLTAATCKLISELSEEQTQILVASIKSPILSFAAGRTIDNSAMDHMDADVREGWGALAATLGMWVREALRYHGQSLRALVGQGCECELASDQVQLGKFISSGYGPLRSCASRYNDAAWAQIGSQTSQSVLNLFVTRAQVQLLHGRGNCQGCPRMCEGKT